MTARLLGLGLLLLLAASACGEAGPVDFQAGTAAGGSPMGVGGTTVQEPCEELPEWRGNDPEFTLEAGDEIRHEGRRYRANEDIEYPNGECQPAMPMDWCAGWFTDLGEC